MKPCKDCDGAGTRFPDDGPRQVCGTCCFTARVNGHRFLFTPTTQSGGYSGRTRWSVHCFTCEEEIHEATTGPGMRVIDHIQGSERLPEPWEKWEERAESVSEP